MTSAERWSDVPERGATAALRFGYATYRKAGRGVFTFLLYPVVAYFLLTGVKTRSASRDYLRRVRGRLEALGRAVPPRLDTFRHFVSFGQAILDKTAMWAGALDPSEVELDDPTTLQRVRDEGRGVLFISSHLGNVEVFRALVDTQEKVKVSPLVFTERSPQLNRLFSAVGPRALEGMIQIDSLGPDSVMKLQDKLRSGEHIAIAADRVSVRHAERSMAVPFLGQPAPFPEGPFILASLLACPVYLIFCLRIGRRYRVFVEPFAGTISLPRKDRAAALRRIIERYAQRLEHYCLMAPMQWFNFFDFWSQANEDRAR
jgi:predicted LPLAT superfamily acyltransferase